MDNELQRGAFDQELIVEEMSNARAPAHATADDPEEEGVTFPKVLAVCESPCSDTNGYGVSLATFLGGWPESNVVQFYRSKRLCDPARRTDRMFYAPMPGNLLLGAVPFFWGSRPEWRGRFSRNWLEKRLGSWRPDAVYSFFYSARLADFADWIAGLFQGPHIVHIGDDGGSITSGNRGELARICAEAAVRVAISVEMKQEYESRFGLPFEVLHNGAADQLFESAGVRKDITNEFVIRYVGSLLRIQHWNAIEDVVEAVRAANRRGVRARFEIYCDAWTKKHALALADGKFVSYEGFAPKPDAYELLKSADLLVLPASFSGTNDNAYRMSMPTKLPEYLASGAPTLVYGPRGMASVELCLRNNLGWVVTERSVAGLTDLMISMDADREQARRRAASDREFAKHHLSAAAASAQFREIVRRALKIRSTGR